MRYVIAGLLLLLSMSDTWGASKKESIDLRRPSVQEDTEDVPVPQGIAPLRPVLDYLRYYESQPARVLPYLTEHFRGGMEPRVWVDQTRALLAAQGYTRLAWTVHRLEVDESGARVHVTTRARIDGQDLLQQELFVLLRTPEGDWLIDDWRLE
ncbi:MAG: hypothetical protein AB7N91_19990 [Candidatus Tectimicrobiota bacterium]